MASAIAYKALRGPTLLMIRRRSVGLGGLSDPVKGFDGASTGEADRAGECAVGVGCGARADRGNAGALQRDDFARLADAVAVFVDPDSDTPEFGTGQFA